jgi:hypothetical protein
MSLEVVINFIRKSEDKWVTKSLPVTSKSLKECFTELVKYINDTIDEYLDTDSFDDKIISEWIYKEVVDVSEEEQFVKVNLFAAKKSLSNILNEISIKKGGLNFHNIKLYRVIINNFLLDINPFINYFRQKTDKNFIFLKGTKFYLTSSHETIMVAHNLFYNSLSKINHLPFKESQGMVSMTIRQSIEIKTKRVFGIYKIKKLRKRANDYGFKRLFDFIEDNSVDIEYNTIDFEILKQIYAWSCSYIHNGETSYHWQTENALSYLKQFFEPISHEDSDKQIMSIFGAFKIKNFNSVRTRLETFIGTDYEVEYLPDNYAEAIIV